jgi:hypothetical protein
LLSIREDAVAPADPRCDPPEKKASPTANGSIDPFVCVPLDVPTEAFPALVDAETPFEPTETLPAGVETPMPFEPTDTPATPPREDPPVRPPTVPLTPPSTPDPPVTPLTPPRTPEDVPLPTTPDKPLPSELETPETPLPSTLETLLSVPPMAPFNPPALLGDAISAVAAQLANKTLRMLRMISSAGRNALPVASKSDRARVTILVGSPSSEFMAYVCLSAGIDF